jgi:serine/threonine protein kinase
VVDGDPRDHLRFALPVNDDQRIAALQAALGSDFHIRRRLGRGSTSTVYEAQELALGRSVAIKVMHPFLVDDEAALKRFEREAKAVAALSHPHVARVYRLGRLPDETPYLVMRLVRGRTMEDRLAAQGALLPELAIPVLKDVVSALAAAHAIGIVHRDVRPANVLWDEENEKALLVDFGISALFTWIEPELASLTQTGSFTGDPRYLSPEQIRNDEVTVLADIYAFGVMAYELLTGEGPYGACTGAELIEAHLDREPRDLMQIRDDVEPNIANVLRRCLNKEPKHRPAASDVSRALDGVWQMWPLDGSGGGVGASNAKKRVVQAVTTGFVASGFIVGGVATLREQYESIPTWAFTESLATGVAIILASVVIGLFPAAEGRQRVPVVEYAALSVIVVAWLIASFAII